METLFSGAVEVPIYQVILLLTLMTVALLFGYTKICMFLCYVFVFYWGNILHIRSIFGSADPDTAAASFGFIGFGLIIVFLAMLGFLLHKE